MVTREEVVQIVKRAGKRIMEVYLSEDMGVESKVDGSPLTRADSLSHELIVDALGKWPHPVLSEESEHAPYSERKNWNTFWLVDPLDGTKDFIKRTGDFTVNVALIENGRPVLGVLGAPFHDVVWSAAGGECFRLSGKVETQVEIQPNTLPMTAADSRFHTGEKTKAFLARYGIEQIVRAGSALKFGRIADGDADVYPRLGPTYEWDIAAGHAIVEAAGGSVVNAETLGPLKYNKENLLNPEFIAASPRFMELLRVTARSQDNEPVR